MLPATQTNDSPCHNSVSKQPAPTTDRRRCGVAAVEFAIVLPILITVLLGITDFGRFSYSAIAITNSARCGASFGSMNPFNPANESIWHASVRQAAIDELSESSAFDTSKLTITITNTTESGGLRRVSVRVAYPFKTIVNWPLIPAVMNLQQTVVMRGMR